MTDQNWPDPGDPQQPPPQNGGTPLPPPQSYGAPEAPPPPNFAPPPSYAQPPNYAQSPSYAQPAYAAPPQPRKKRKIWPWILGFFGIIILGIGGCTYFVYGALAAPVGASNDFLAEAQARDYAGAAALASKTDACFGANAEGVLTEFFAPWPFTSYDLNQTSVSSFNGESTAQVSGTIVVDGEQRSVGMSLTKESDKWLVCGIEIN